MSDGHENTIRLDAAKPSAEHLRAAARMLASMPSAGKENQSRWLVADWLWLLASRNEASK